MPRYGFNALLNSIIGLHKVSNATKKRVSSNSKKREVKREKKLEAQKGKTLDMRLNKVHIHGVRNGQSTIQSAATEGSQSTLTQGSQLLIGAMHAIEEESKDVESPQEQKTEKVSKQKRSNLQERKKKDSRTSSDDADDLLVDKDELYEIVNKASSQLNHELWNQEQWEKLLARKIQGLILPMKQPWDIVKVKICESKHPTRNAQKWKSWPFAIIGYAFLNDVEGHGNLHLVICHFLNACKVRVVPALDLDPPMTKAQSIVLRSFFKTYATSLGCKKLLKKFRQKKNENRNETAGAAAIPSNGNDLAIDPMATVGTGFYMNFDQTEQQFVPSLINIKSLTHYGPLDQQYNDCVAHAANNLLGCEWFQCRQQVIRLMMARLNYNKEIATAYKRDHGFRPDLLSGMICDNETVYQVRQIFFWSIEQKEQLGWSQLTTEQFEHECCKDSRQALIATITYPYADKICSHAFVIKHAGAKGLACMDSLFDRVFYTRTQNTNDEWDLEEWIEGIQSLTLYTIEPMVFTVNRKLMPKNRKTPEQLKQRQMALIKRIMTDTMQCKKKMTTVHEESLEVVNEQQA